MNVIPGRIFFVSRGIIVFSPAYYYKFGTSGNALKCHIISAGLWLHYLQTSLFISIYLTAVGIISPVEFAKDASHYQYNFMGKS
jgi:hypothetical protein